MLRKFWRKYFSKTFIVNKARYEKEKLVRQILTEVRTALGDMKYDSLTISNDILRRLIRENETAKINETSINEIYLEAVKNEYERS